MDRVTVVILKEQLRVRGLKLSGNKAELFLRLSDAWHEEGRDMEQELRQLELDSQGATGGGSETEKEQLDKDHLEKSMGPRDSASEVGSQVSRVSQLSGKSNRGSMVESKARSTARRVALEIRAQALQKKAELDRKEAELDRKEALLKLEKEQLEIDTELAEAKAEEKVWNEAEQELIALELEMEKKDIKNVTQEGYKNAGILSNGKESYVQLKNGLTEHVSSGTSLEGSSTKPQLLTNPGLGRDREEFQNCDKKDTKNIDQISAKECKPDLSKDLVTALISSNLKALMPRQEIRKFRGEYTEYYIFTKTFDSLIGESLTSDCERLRYLQQYTEGQPKEIVQACMHLEPTEGYKRAREMLDKRYGCQEQIATAYIEKILQWKDISRDNVEALDEFAVTLFSCKNAVSCVPYGIAELNNPKTLRIILTKLPFSMQEKWRKIADEIMTCKKQVVTFDTLVEFIEKEARIAKNPLFGRHLFSNKSSSKSGIQSSSKITINTINARRELECWNCQGSHILDECDDLKSKKHDDRVRIIRELRLCFRCLRRGHISKECRTRKTCESCSGDHHTLMHKETDATENMNVISSGRIGVYLSTQNRVNGCMSVVPVRINLKGHQVITRAFLDNGSAGTFCKESLLERLGLKTKTYKSVELSVGTMHGEHKMGCSLIDGVKVSDFDGNNIISLPPLYAVKNLPVTKYDTFSKDEVSQWSHLRDVRIPECDEEIELLIGTNAPEALQPWEIINSENSEPFAYKTKLGWVVCGTVNYHGRRVSVNTLAIRSELELDVSTEEYNKDVQEICMLEEENSVEEKKGLEQVDAGSRQIREKHEIPLAIKASHQRRPDRKQMALNRQKGKLEHNILYKIHDEDFKEQMLKEDCEGIGTKFYQKEVTENERNFLWWKEGFEGLSNFTQVGIN